MFHGPAWLDASQKICQRAEARLLLNGYVADGFRHDARGNGIDEVAVIGLGNVDFDGLAAGQHIDGYFRVQGDV